MAGDRLHSARHMTVAVTEHPLDVLVVENDPAVELLLVLILKQQRWHVTTARGDQAAIETLRAKSPDLLLLDVVPNPSGHPVLEWIEQTDSSWMQHVILLTTESTSAVAAMREARAVSHILRKPFNVVDLVESVKSCSAAFGGKQHGMERTSVEKHQ